VSRICVAYEKMEKYFPAEKIILTGNPVRNEINKLQNEKEKALQHFGLSPGRKVLLVTGGSLGAKTINLAVMAALELLNGDSIQVIWQTGKNFYSEAQRLAENYRETVKVFEFIGRMDLAYSAADLVVSRAGAGAVSELAIAALPSIFIPSPNVAEDHQTKNALTLMKKNAGLLIPDREAVKRLGPEVIGMMADDARMRELSHNIAEFAIHDSAHVIANEVIRLGRHPL
jgi:UDP-N-acetylglucosamine--N-acetylmuramyl-(pentapeptide) pyrophosphoryl-undecaprenol N-acetylglucosamine transferase